MQFGLTKPNINCNFIKTTLYFCTDFYKKQVVFFFCRKELTFEEDKGGGIKIYIGKKSNDLIKC